MRFTCKKCQTKYTIADERIREKAVKFRCKRCNTVLVVRAKPSPVLLDKPRPEWFYGLDGEEHGPFSLKQLQAKIGAGEVSENCYVWRKGAGDWVPVEDVPELAQAMKRAAELRRQTEASEKALEREREAAIRSRRQAEEKQRREVGRARQDKLYSKRREERESKAEQEKDTGRQELLKRVLKRREKARADRHADRIADHFFDDGQEGTGEDRVLPPPSVAAAENLADALDRESLQEEHEALQQDPLAVLVKRDQPGQSGISKVSKVIAAQAGMSAVSKGRRLTITLLCAAGVLVLVGGGIYLAVTQGWFGGFGSTEKHKAGRTRSRVNIATGELSEQEAKRLRDSLWKIKRKSRGGRSVGLPGFDIHVPMQKDRKLTEEERKLQAFYQNQGKEKRELRPRIPDSALLPTPSTVDLPTAPVSSLDAPLLAKKSEVSPQGPENTAGPGRLSDFQVRVVIQKHYQQVKSCLERQLKRDATISGKMYVVARVNPRGRVEKVSIVTPKFNGTFVEECLIKEVGRWEFPTFKGETYDITFPLLLTARQTY
jgi:predicted Zn finger-like uncharacterized protein